VKEYGTAGQATDSIATGRMRFACWIYDVLYTPYTPYFRFYIKNQ
jgi:hypothetical protein